MLFPNGPDWVVAFLAAARIGAVAVPINTFFQARELGFLLRHADVQALLLAPRFLSHDYLARLLEIAPGARRRRGCAPPALPSFRSSDTCSCRRPPGPRAGRSPLAPLLATPRDDALPARGRGAGRAADPLAILYSSGSTADPKGAVHGHGAVLRHSLALARARDVADRRPRLVADAVLLGGRPRLRAAREPARRRLHALRGGLRARSARSRFLERERATIAIGWPHFGKALAEHPSRAERDLSSLRGGNVPDLLPEEVCPADPELRANALGMTETCGPHTWGGRARLPEALRGSFGTAVPGVEHKVVDPASGATLPRRRGRRDLRARLQR